MHRRDFISAFGKASLLASTASIAANTGNRSRELADQGIDKLGQHIGRMKKRIDRMEAQQKNMTRALLFITAISTGIDLSLLV